MGIYKSLKKHPNLKKQLAVALQECYKNLGLKKGDFPIAEEISSTELSIPMYYGMKEEEIQYVIKKINEFE